MGKHCLLSALNYLPAVEQPLAAREEKREAGRNESETERQGGREGERQSGGRRRKALINTALLLKCCLEDKQLFPAKLSECSGRQLSRTERGREIDG